MPCPARQFRGRADRDDDPQLHVGAVRVTFLRIASIMSLALRPFNEATVPDAEDAVPRAVLAAHALSHIVDRRVVAPHRRERGGVEVAPLVPARETGRDQTGKASQAGCQCRQG